MSSIAFYFEDTTLRVGGSERAHMGSLCAGIAQTVLKLRLPYPTQITPAWYMHGNAAQAVMETAWATGSRPVRLAALLYYYCETNTVIDGAAFAEVADALEEGRRLGIFREETQRYEGIDAVIARLRQGGAWCALGSSLAGSFPRELGCDDDDFTIQHMTAAETVAALRAEGNVLVAGDLDRPLFPENSSSIWTLDIEQCHALARGRS